MAESVWRMRFSERIGERRSTAAYLLCSGDGNGGCRMDVHGWDRKGARGSVGYLFNNVRSRD